MVEVNIMDEEEMVEVNIMDEEDIDELINSMVFTPENSKTSKRKPSREVVFTRDSQIDSVEILS